MRKEVIIEKENCKYKVAVRLYGTDYYSNKICYRFEYLMVLPKGKRKWRELSRSWSDSYEYRRTDYEERGEYIKKKYLEYLTPDDIRHIKQMLFDDICEKLNPDLEDNCDFPTY